MHFMRNFSEGNKNILIGGRSPVLGTSGTTVKNLNVLDNLISYRNLAVTTVSVSSSNQAADIAAGTGAQKVHVFGLNAAGAPVSETISLNATDGRTTATGLITFSAVFAAEISAGSGRVNAGDIYVYTTGTALTAGVPTALTTTWVKILVGMSSGDNGYYVVPAGHTASISKVMIHTRSQIAVMSVWAEPVAANGGLGALEQIWSMGLPATTPVVETEILNSYSFRAGTALYLRITPTTTLAMATANMVIALTKQV